MDANEAVAPLPGLKLTHRKLLLDVCKAIDLEVPSQILATLSLSSEESGKKERRVRRVRREKRRSAFSAVSAFDLGHAGLDGGQDVGLPRPAGVVEVHADVHRWNSGLDARHQ